MNIQLTCTYCHKQIDYEVKHPKYGWCLICHNRVGCPTCRSPLKVVNQESLRRALEGFTGHEHRCKVGTCRETEISLHRDPQTPYKSPLWLLGMYYSMLGVGFTFYAALAYGLGFLT